jgi:hypothetical protein
MPSGSPEDVLAGVVVRCKLDTKIAMRAGIHGYVGRDALIRWILRLAGASTTTRGRKGRHRVDPPRQSNPSNGSGGCAVAELERVDGVLGQPVGGVEPRAIANMRGRMIRYSPPAGPGDRRQHGARSCHRPCELRPKTAPEPPMAIARIPRGARPRRLQRAVSFRGAPRSPWHSPRGGSRTGSGGVRRRVRERRSATPARVWCSGQGQR